MGIKNPERAKKVRQTAVLVAIVSVAGGGASLWLADRLTENPRSNSDISTPVETAAPPMPELQIYKPLLPDEAKIENEKLPFSNAPLERALPLVLPSSELVPMARRTATDCLTSAIYYEAGYELNQGKRAVAQVILNRVRHPAYPKTICGVVYQGSERKTGCQFTFTCDGSLARRPARDRWEQARLIAIGAITGAVEPSVGMATHYHANYVMPYWAPSLDKVSQIGTHIFYRWKGSWGRRRAFSQVVQLDSDATNSAAGVAFLPIEEDILTAEPASKQLTSRIIADEIAPASALLTPSSEIKAPMLSEIQADQKRSKLAIDEVPLNKN